MWGFQALIILICIVGCSALVLWLAFRKGRWYSDFACLLIPVCVVLLGTGLSAIISYILYA